MKKYNKYGAEEKNITEFDTEIITEYKGEKLPDDVLMVKCYSKTNECHVAFIPDYENKRIGTKMDKTDVFATSVLQWLIDSGTAERLMKEIYDLLWSEQSQANVVEPSPSQLPNLQPIPDNEYHLVSPEYIRTLGYN